LHHSWDWSALYISYCGGRGHVIDSEHSVIVRIFDAPTLLAYLHSAYHFIVTVATSSC